jgi:hypothetical protein
MKLLNPIHEMQKRNVITPPPNMKTYPSVDFKSLELDI